jgi:hypothetical protein
MIASHIEVILGGSTVELDSDGMHCGHLSDEAYDAVVAVADCLDETTWDPSDIWEPWAAEDYLRDTSLADFGLSGASTPEEISDVAESIVLEGGDVHMLDEDDVTRYLTHYVEEARDEQDNEDGL